jgi:serine/threonine protein kinase
MSQLNLQSSLDPAAALLVEELIDKLQAGEADVEAFLADHPAHTETLQRLLPALRVLADLSSSSEEECHGCASDLAPSGELGDFRIVREVGRGGMGVVYEAEQISLARRVALKVLPFGATMDSKQLQRFQNEARAAASLEHPNIVPVYGVGCERGVHYYAMKFIDGQSLAALIHQQRENLTRSDSHASGGVQTSDSISVKESLVRTTKKAAAQAERAPFNMAAFRRVAEWGIQAAEALEYAHDLGIVHRDIKPANLIIDGRGKLWVTDFGLARTATDAGLTMTGDLLGTLRYMSPEQALAKHGLVDHRTDLYALSATLYELLTLRPAVDGQDREELLRNIAFADTVPPRRLTSAIPVDLETIILKGLGKEPGERYATANHLATDLRRFLSHEPILAKRPTWPSLLVKWSRRHQSVVGTAIVVLFLMLMGSLVSIGLIASAYNAEATQREKTAEALVEAEKQKKKAQENEAKAAEERERAITAITNLKNALRLARRFFSWPPGERSELDNFTELTRELVVIWDNVAAAWPGDADYARMRWMNYAALAELLEEDGQFQEAVKAQRQALECVEKWKADFPNDRIVRAAQKSFRLTSCLKLGDLLRATGQSSDAEKAYRQALALCEELLLQEKVSRFWRRLPEINNSLGGLYLEAGRLREARQAYAQALALFDGPLPADVTSIPNWPDVQAWEHSRSHNGLGEIFLASGAKKEATEEFRHALRWLERLPANGTLGRRQIAEVLAWFLVACPIQELQDPQRAMQLMRQEKLSSAWWFKVSGCRYCLALAQYRIGDWNGAWKVLLPHRASDGPVSFVYAMTLWQLKKNKEAQNSFQETVRWMDKNRPRDVELRRFRAEAAELLGIKDK